MQLPGTATPLATTPTAIYLQDEVLSGDLFLDVAGEDLSVGPASVAISSRSLIHLPPHNRDGPPSPAVHVVLRRGHIV
jgi:hypothetical protein